MHSMSAFFLTSRRVFALSVALSSVLLLSAQQTSYSALTPSYGATDVPFCTVAEGRRLPVTWGMDAAWISQENVRRGMAFIGKENIANLRVSFQPTQPLVGDTALSAAQRSDLNRRISIARMLDHPDLIVNSDPAEGKVSTYFSSSTGNANTAHWAKLIDVSTRAYEDAGFRVITVSPFNEPDYGWGQGTMSDFRDICCLLRTDYADHFKDIRISAGNTLNCDRASEWYNYMKPYVDEGCTHQLAGSFGTYASFFSEVRTDGLHATADELHNVMEAMVGVEYGMQTGIWWGFDALARGQFCRASQGDRLAYAENRKAWAAASVYRNTLDGCIEAFIGTSERQAAPSSWHFVCTDRDVYFDGYGPTREFTVDMPGGNGYQQGQTNAERVVAITWGDDVPPAPIDGTYLVVNVNSGKVLSLQNGQTTSGTALCQHILQTGRKYQQWQVNSVPSDIGGDFSYHSICSAANGFPIDVWNWSLDHGGDVRLYNGTLGTNEQWYLQYAGNGCYYIRSRYSNLCLEVASGSTTSGAAVRQGIFAAHPRQQWKFLPVDARVEQTPPTTPQRLTAQPHNASVELRWQAVAADDLVGYHVLRAEAASGQWNTIGRAVADTVFIDNTLRPGTPYIYKVKAIDRSVNFSPCSDEVSAATDGTPGLVARWDFDNVLSDDSPNAFVGFAYTPPLFTDNFRYVASGSHALRLDGTNFVQLPYGVAQTDALTVSLWMYWNGASSGSNQRIFDFFNGPGEGLFLTPSGSDGKMRFVIAHAGKEQELLAPKFTPLRLQHIALTLSADSVILYVDGERKAVTDAITLHPSDICPVLCYLGRSQNTANPLLKAYIDDVRIYNCALTPLQVRQVMASVDTAVLPPDADGDPVAEECDADISLYDISGRPVTEPDTTLSPGIYIRDHRKLLIR